MKKIASLLLAGVCAFALAACRSAAATSAISAPATSAGAGQSEGQPPATGSENALGEENKTLFFDFVVVSATAVDSYAGLRPAEGNQLVDVVIRSTNTFGEDIVMLEYDFQLQWGDGSDPTAFAYPVDAVDESMAPLEYNLPDAQSMEYHYVYEVPAEVREMRIAYEEAYIDMEGNEGYGDVFFVPFNV